MSTVDKGYVVFKAQEDANTFLRSNPDFRPTSMHQSWQGKIKCKHCTVAGWPRDIRATKNWSNKHGANCKKKSKFYMNMQTTWNTNFNFTTTSNHSTGTAIDFNYYYNLAYGTPTLNFSSYITITGV